MGKSRLLNFFNARLIEAHWSSWSSWTLSGIILGSYSSQQEIRESVVSSLFSLLKGLPTLQELRDITTCLTLPRTTEWHFFWINLLRFPYHSSIILLKGLCLSHISSYLIFHGKELFFFSVVGEDFGLKGIKKQA